MSMEGFIVKQLHIVVISVSNLSCLLCSRTYRADWNGRERLSYKKSVCAFALSLD